MTLVSALGARHEPGAPAMNKRLYPWVLVGLLSFNFGVVYFDRNTLNFLMPLIQPELHLSNKQVGLLGSVLGASWAIAGFGIGRLSDATGQRKLLLVVCALVFSAASVLQGWASGFAMLVATRVLMGFAEGGVMPISQALIAAEVDPARRGLAMGVTQNFAANLLSNFLGPIVLVAIGEALGWRRAFYLAGIPGVMAALLMMWLIREPAREELAGQDELATAPVSRDAWKHRNVLLCIGLSILLVAFVVVFAIFMPLYLASVRGLEPRTWSWLMSMFGLTSMAFAFLVPGSSDVLGRRPVVISMSLIGALIPLSALYVDQPLWLVFVLFGSGAAISGCFPLAMATIPSETVPPQQLATVLGLTMGFGEIIGGVVSPAAAGWVADVSGLQATLWILVGLSAATGILACFIQETAPRVLHRRLASQPVRSAPTGG
jgi:MFS transporter, ACS family, hexuronate transporter